MALDYRIVIRFYPSSGIYMATPQFGILREQRAIKDTDRTKLVRKVRDRWPSAKIEEHEEFRL